MENSRLAKRFRNMSSNIWVDFNDLAARFCDVNLGQGQPGFAPPEYIQKNLADAALDGNEYLQYTREQGHPRLVNAIAALHGPLLGRTIDPMTEVITTHGAYEGLSITILSLVNPGDEVILIEPCYDAYEPMTKMAEGIPVFIPLRPKVTPATKSSDWILDPDELASKFSSKTKMIILNTPNNPIGKVYSKAELEMIASLCIKHDVLCLSDEVYEWLVYPGNEHHRIACVPGMWERTITVSSAGKSFSVTGWRVGWSVGPKHLIDCLMTAHVAGDCVCTTPAQEAIARCIETEIPRLNDENGHFTSQLAMLRAKRDTLAQVLFESGFTPCIPEGGYFILADWSKVATNQEIDDGSDDHEDFKFSKWLIKKHKLCGIPTSAFYGEHKSEAGKYIRLCFFATDEKMNEARQILSNIH